MTKQCYEWLFSDDNSNTNTDIRRLFLNGSTTADLVISSPNRASSELTSKREGEDDDEDEEVCLFSSLDQSLSVEHLPQLKIDYTNLVINLLN